MCYELQDENTETMTGKDFRYFDDAYRMAKDIAQNTGHEIAIWDNGRYLMTIKRNPKS